MIIFLISGDFESLPTIVAMHIGCIIAHVYFGKSARFVNNVCDMNKFKSYH